MLGLVLIPVVNLIFRFKEIANGICCVVPTPLKEIQNYKTQTRSMTKILIPDQVPNNSPTPSTKPMSIRIKIFFLPVICTRRE